MKYPESHKFVEEIEKHYALGKADRISRYSVEWGKWSREMNLKLRMMLDQNDPESEGLKAVYSIWICYSVILELWFRSKQKWFKKKQKEEARKVIKYLKLFIKTGEYPEEIRGKYRTVDPRKFPLGEDELAKGDN